MGVTHFENSNKPHGFGVLNPETFTPFPKNPVIAAFFRQIGRADELGSGMRKMMRYGKAFGGDDPEMIEGDVFKIVVKVPEFGSNGELGGGPKSDPRGPFGGSSQPRSTQQATQQVTQQVKKLVGIIYGEMARVELMTALSLRDRVNFTRNYLVPALSEGLIEMTQPESPQSPTQKYRLTEKGRNVLKRIEGGSF